MNHGTSVVGGITRPLGSPSARAVLDSARAAQQRIDIDPERLAVWGFS